MRRTHQFAAADGDFLLIYWFCSPPPPADPGSDFFNAYVWEKLGILNSWCLWWSAQLCRCLTHTHTLTLTHPHTHSMLLLGGVGWAHTVGCFFFYVSSSRGGIRWKKCGLLGSVMPLGCYCSALISLAGLCSRLKAVMDFGREGSSRSNVFWHFFLRLWFIPSLNKS